MNNFGDKVTFIWSVADLLRDSFKRAKYPDVILPLTVLRRLDCVLEPTKAKVLETHAKLKGRLENLAPQLCKASGFAFYNTSQFTFERLLQDHAHLAANLRAYINGFSDNMREVLEKFDFGNTICKLDTLSSKQLEAANAATAAQIIAETLEESEGKEPPIEAAREFAGVLERIAQVDRNFKFVAPVVADDEYAESDPATLEYEEAGPEKELDDETGKEFELEPTPVDEWTRDTQEVLAGEIAEIRAVSEASQPKEEGEPVILKAPGPEDDKYGFAGDDDDFEIPELTPEITAKMFANMKANGYL